MSDGLRTPAAFDGMACFPVRGARAPGRAGPQSRDVAEPDRGRRVRRRPCAGSRDPAQQDLRFHARRRAQARRHDHPDLGHAAQAAGPLAPQPRRHLRQLRRRSDALGLLADLRGNDRERAAAGQPAARLGVRGAVAGARAGRSGPADRDGPLRPRGGDRRSAHRHRLFDRGSARQPVLPLPAQCPRPAWARRAAAGARRWSTSASATCATGRRTASQFAGQGTVLPVGGAVARPLDRHGRRRFAQRRPEGPRLRQGRAALRPRRGHHARPGGTAAASSISAARWAGRSGSARCGATARAAREGGAGEAGDPGRLELFVETERRGPAQELRQCRRRRHGAG